MTRSSAVAALPGYSSKLALLGLSLLLACAFCAAPQARTDFQPPNDAQHFVREAVSVELRALKNDDSLWRYRQISWEGLNSEQFEIVQTASGDIVHLLGKDNRPLLASESAAEQSKINAILKNPERFKSRAHKEADQNVRDLEHLLGTFSAAFLYTARGFDGGRDKFDFTADPFFRPRSREDEVFRHMHGSVWIDHRQMRIAKIQGRLTSEVDFGFGILGHLDQGGTFLLQQKDLGNGHWEPTRIAIDMDGKILFFKSINIHQDKYNFDYKLVPQDTTLAQAAEILKQRIFPWAEKDLASLEK